MNSIVKDLKAELNEAVEWFKNEISKISAGRATPEMLDSIKVDAYGIKQPIKSLASISVEDARTLIITPWSRDDVRPIYTAIIDSKLPFSVTESGAVVRVSVPQLTTEDKERLVKTLIPIREQVRASVRDHRNKALKNLKALGLSEDEENLIKKEIESVVHEANNKINELFEKKENEIMSA